MSGRWLATLRALLAGELKMQLRQRMTVLMVLLLPMIATPGALVGSVAYRSSVKEVEQATRPPSGSGGNAVVPALPVAVPPGVERWLLPSDGLVAVDAEDALAALSIEDDRAHITYSPTFRSVQALSRLDRVVQRRSRQLRGMALDAAGVAPLPSGGVRTHVVDLSAAPSSGGPLIVPLAMLAMLMAAAYTALDVLTGERERGTLETLLTTHADHSAILAAKTMLVGGTTLAAGYSGLIGVLLASRASAVGPPLPGIPEIGAGTALFLALALALLSVSATALAVVFAIGAPSYRSASLSMGFVVLLPALPAGLGAMSLELTPTMAAVPVGNVSLAVRDALAGTLTAGDALLVLLFALCWAGLSVGLTVARVGREGALLAVHDAAALRRAGFYGREAAGVFGLSLLLVWLVGSAVQAVDLAWGLLLTEGVLFAGVGLAGVSWVGLPWRETLSLRLPSARDAALALIAGLCAPALGGLALAAQDPFLPIPAPITELLTGLGRDRSPLVSLALFALLPAVCEELMFRGALLGMTRKTPPVARVLLNALMFGAAHLSIHRLLPTGVLGLLMATAAVRSRSIVPGMIVHLLNNSLLVLLSSTSAEEGPDLPASVVILAPLALVSIGAVAAMGRSRPD